MLTLETLPSLGFHVATFSQFSFYSFLGCFSSISDVGSCPSSRPLDAGRPQGLDEPSLPFLFPHNWAHSALNTIQRLLSPNRLSVAPAFPLSSRHFDIQKWVPTQSLKWNRSKQIFYSVLPLNPQAHTHCSSLRLPCLTVPLLSTSLLKPTFQESSLLPHSSHRLHAIHHHVC